MEGDSEDTDLIFSVLSTVRGKVTTAYMSHKLGWTWPRTKSTLLELAVEGKVNAERTVYGWLFSLRSKEQVTEVRREEPIAV
jgi:hypothetical protein